MNNKNFDELSKSIAQSVTRRDALRKFGVGSLAVVGASLGMRSASAAPAQKSYCEVVFNVGNTGSYTGLCINPATCQYGPSQQCKGTTGGRYLRTGVPCVGTEVDAKKPCSF